ncbi:hypothetical protein AB0G60_26430 [Streptomyces angustmyceticus]|nr:hypothetical protein [Streptomyces angustmyceticus]
MTSTPTAERSHPRSASWSARSTRRLPGDSGAEPRWSVALVGAYVLAGELAMHSGHTAAFAAYERRLRPFAERNQALATRGDTAVTPTTREQLESRNALLRDPESIAKEMATASAQAGRTAHSGLLLPEYAGVL